MAEQSIANALRRVAAARGEKTFCPSEVARELSSSWRPLMPEVRAEAQRLIEREELRCTQRGKPVSPLSARGPIRLSAKI